MKTKALYLNGNKGFIETSGVATNQYLIYYWHPGDEVNRRKEYLNRAMLNKALANKDLGTIESIFALVGKQAIELKFEGKPGTYTCEDIQLSISVASLVELFKNCPEKTVLFQAGTSYERASVVVLLDKALKATTMGDQEMYQRYGIYENTKEGLELLVLNGRNETKKSIVLWRRDLDPPVRLLPIRNAINSIVYDIFDFDEEFVFELPQYMGQVIVTRVGEKANIKIEKSPDSVLRKLANQRHKDSWRRKFGR